MFFKSNSTYDWLIVGLGNPGMTYENTRHNVGFITVDKLAEKENFEFNKIKFSAKIGEYKLKDNRILVIKPETYMNNSGKAVLEASSFYKIPADRIIVIQDDISLNVGKLRIRRKGSDGGQKGMRDIIELLGTDNIARIKIGVGAKPHPDYNLADWVLSKFKTEEKEPLNNACDNAVLAIKEIITCSIDSAMNKFNN